MRKEMIENRDEMKELREKGKELFSEQKEKMKAMLKTVKEDKINVKDKALKVRECKTESSEECKTKFKDFKGDMKTYYNNMLDIAENHLKRLMDKINAEVGMDKDKRSLSDGDVKRLAIEVGDLEDKISKLRARVNGITETTTKEELRNLHNEVKSLVKEVRLFINKVTQMKAKMRFAGVLERAEQLENRLKNILENAKKNNKDISKLEPLIREFENNIINAKMRFEEIKALMIDKFIGAAEKHRIGGLDKNENFKVLMEIANDALKGAHQSLIRIHEELKNKQIEVEVQ
jgi:hypothetical protein